MRRIITKNEHFKIGKIYLIVCEDSDKNQRLTICKYIDYGGNNVLLKIFDRWKDDMKYLKEEKENMLDSCFIFLQLRMCEIRGDDGFILYSIEEKEIRDIVGDELWEEYIINKIL